MLTIILPLLLCFQSVSATKVGLFMPAPFEGGTPSINDTVLLDAMIKILHRYDLTAVHDYTEMSILEPLFKELKKRYSDYEIVLNHGISRPGINMTETVGFIYNSSAFGVGELSLDQTSGIVYAKVKVVSNDYHFVIGDIDVDFRHAIRQLNNIPSAYQRIVKATGLKDVLLSGDFVTGVPFVNWQQYENLTVTKDSRFKWYIKYTDNTLDWALVDAALARFLGVEGITKHVIPSSDIVFDFITAYKLTSDQAHRISFSYPIELQLDF